MKKTLFVALVACFSCAPDEPAPTGTEYLYSADYCFRWTGTWSVNGKGLFLIVPGLAEYICASGLDAGAGETEPSFPFPGENTGYVDPVVDAGTVPDAGPVLLPYPEFPMTPIGCAWGRHCLSTTTTQSCSTNPSVFNKCVSDCRKKCPRGNQGRGHGRGFGHGHSWHQHSGHGQGHDDDNDRHNEDDDDDDDDRRKSKEECEEECSGVGTSCTNVVSCDMYGYSVECE